MGTIFSLPLAQSADLAADLALMASHGFDTIATVTDAVAARLHRDDEHDRSPWLNGDREAAAYLNWPLGRVQKLSAAGVAVVAADMKGDVSGIAQPGERGGPAEKRAEG